ncbi:hypothetical protein LAZ67_23000652, partial [Cordylochernes scorpioides]
MPGHRKRRQFKQTDAFTRGIVIRLKRAGWSIRQIAADIHLGASTVHRLWRRWLEQGNVAINRNVGATRVTSARVDRRILRQAVAAPQATCTAILQHVQDTLDHSISTRTISRRLVANGLHSCRPLRRLPLTPPNRRQRLEWCRARSTWMTEWHRVVFSDESRFCLSSDSRRVRVWRRRGERSNPAAIVERPTVRQRGIMGTMTAQRYVDDVLRPVTLPYLQGVPNALYQQDNARPHTARISQQALQDVQMLPWPPYSPDLSPIEHVWDIIGRRLHALPQPRSEDELWQMVEREWRAIPQDTIRTLIDSLPRRVAACIAVREATILTGCFQNEVFIPRIPLIHDDKHYPLHFKRLQFPIRVSFVMSINKAQGQSLKIAGIDLEQPCFSHGQLIRHRVDRMNKDEKEAREQEIGEFPNNDHGPTTPPPLLGIIILQLATILERLQPLHPQDLDLTAFDVFSLPSPAITSYAQRQQSPEVFNSSRNHPFQ